MNEGNWYQDSEENPDQHRPAGSAARPGMSTGMKVFIGVMIVAGIVGLLCCGGLFFIGAKVADMETEDPVAIQQIQEEIAGIELPEGSIPKFGIDGGFLGYEMKYVVYDRDNAFFVLAQFNLPGPDSDVRSREQVRQVMQQKGYDFEIEVESSEERMLTVAGEEVPFEFVIGKNHDGEDVRQVSGLFAGRGGTAFLRYQVPESDWDEDQVVNMIEGIRN